MKITCNKCKWFGEVIGIYQCWYPDNISIDYKGCRSPIKYPESINRNLNCEWFELTLSRKIFKSIMNYLEK